VTINRSPGPPAPPGHPIANIKSIPAEALSSQRRVFGIILGALLGLIYGLVSQSINRIALPGVPLYQPPLGPLGNTALSALVGAGLGLLVALPMSSALGIALASIASAIAIMVSSVLRLGDGLSTGTQLVFGVLLSVPLSWFTVPVTALLRWAVDRQVDQQARGEPLLMRWRVPLALVLVMVFVAAFELHGTTIQAQLRTTDRMLETALAATDPADVPAPLQGPLVRDFPVGSGADYTLEWTRQDLDRFIELRPSANYDQHVAVIARLAGGYRLVCLFPTARSGPTCGTY
jgi:hypothetical protein